MFNDNSYKDDLDGERKTMQCDNKQLERYILLKSLKLFTLRGLISLKTYLNYQ